VAYTRRQALPRHPCREVVCEGCVDNVLLLWNNVLVDQTELRHELHTLGLSQVDFARLIGVTPRAVTLWLAGQRAVPPPVSAYLRLLTAAPASMRQAEFQLLKESGNSMRDGMYCVVYSSQDSGPMLAGLGFVIFDGGKIYGGDPGGCQYNGAYAFDGQTGIADVHLKLTFSPNGVSVFGVSLPYEWSVDASCTFDPTSVDGLTRITTSLGQTVDVKFQFMRALPDAA
jgi:transcriptional regulator with XRE-family HTH domain